MRNFFSTTKEHDEALDLCHAVRRHGSKVLGCPWLTVTHARQYDFAGDIEGIAEYSRGIPETASQPSGNSDDS